MEATQAGWSIFGLLIGLVVLLIGILGLVLWVWMLMHSITNKGLTDGERIMWVLLIILLPLLGMILYFFIGRPKKAAAELAR